MRSALPLLVLLALGDAPQARAEEPVGREAPAQKEEEPKKKKKKVPAQPSKQPAKGPAAQPARKSQPSAQPAKKSEPSKSPSAQPAKKSEPSKSPSAQPAKKADPPKSQPSAQPAKKADPPKSQPSAQPARKSQPSAQPAKKSEPSEGATPARRRPQSAGGQGAEAPKDAASDRRPTNRPTAAKRKVSAHHDATPVRATAKRPEVRGAPKSHAHDRVKAWHTRDHRYAHPAPHHVRHHPHAHRAPPHRHWYRSWYTRYWVHPYYRWVAATSVYVAFDYRPYAWVATWAPPVRAGWTWVPGHTVGVVWVPGHWLPVRSAPVVYGRTWAYVPGWWVGDYYVEGYWRADARGDGWVWVEGHYRPDGSYAWGHWEPRGTAPDGYVWEPGFWDGESWAEGFWRPESRVGYRWVSAAYDEDGVFHAGYWEPIEEKPGSVWIPGWFDGHEWQEGYWVSEAEYERADPENYQPEEGWDDGWKDAPDQNATGDEAPLAMPVE